LTNGPQLKQLLKDSLLAVRNHEPVIARWALSVLTLMLLQRGGVLEVHIGEDADVLCIERVLQTQQVMCAITWAGTAPG
jgi:hypothetical protein